MTAPDPNTARPLTAPYAATGTCRYCRKPIEFSRNYWRHNYIWRVGLRACDERITCLGGLEATPGLSS